MFFNVFQDRIPSPVFFVKMALLRKSAHHVAIWRVFFAVFVFLLKSCITSTRTSKSTIFGGVLVPHGGGWKGRLWGSLYSCKNGPQKWPFFEGRFWSKKPFLRSKNTWTSQNGPKIVKNRPKMTKIDQKSTIFHQNRRGRSTQNRPRFGRQTPGWVWDRKIYKKVKKAQKC